MPQILPWLRANMIIYFAVPKKRANHGFTTTMCSDEKEANKCNLESTKCSDEW